MSRNFTSDQQLTDRLYFSDTDAFDELYQRYWYHLYLYSFKKIRCSEDAKKIVRDVFVSLWNNRESWPLNFSVSEYFYTEVRKAVVRAVNQKLIENHDIAEDQIVDFSTEALLQSKLPVKKRQQEYRRPAISREKKFYSLFNFKRLGLAPMAKMN